MEQSDYYVYVYIDPRDFTEFYYGMGRGNRKEAHLLDKSDSEKARTIRSIRDDGLDPVIKVIAKGLTQEEAFLVEKTLIWKLGRNLTNVSSGKYAEKFRRHKTLHIDLHGFDYETGLYFFNIGDAVMPEWRNWADMRRYSFITAGGGPVYSKPIRTFGVGDVFCAYQTGSGYVGVGIIAEEAVPYRKFRIDGKVLSQTRAAGNYGHDAHDLDLCEWMCAVRWVKTVTSPKWGKNSGLFAKQMIKASLQDQKRTVHFLEDQFDVDFNVLRRRSASRRRRSAV